MIERPTAISLFAGAGGLCEGLESAGINVVAAVELHPQPALTCAFNHPNTSVLVGNIRQLTMDLLEDKVRRRVGSTRIDLVAGGPPCQGFSTAGKKVSSDPRNELFREFVRFVDHFRPRMFLLENVPGFKKMHQGRAHSEAVKLFSGLGYQTVDTIITAAAYGVPQRRNRFVMVGWLRGEGLDFDWPAPTTSTDGSQAVLALAPSSHFPVTTLNAIGDLAFLQPGWECHRHQQGARSAYERARRGGGMLLFNHLATRHRKKAVEMFSHIPEGGTISRVPAELRTGKRTMARLDRNEIANAVLALPDDMIHYLHNRILSVREMARLQSFDDNYVFFGKRTSGFVERRVDVPQYTQVGNAVPPLLGRALGSAIVQTLGGVVHDARALETRRSRLAWVRGSSGFAGYGLGPEASKHITMETVLGEALPLPLLAEAPRVIDSEPLVEWVRHENPKRGQWAPGVTPRSVPAYHDLPEAVRRIA